MEQKIIFREMLSEIKELADAKGGRLTVDQIDDFFASAQLAGEQMEMIYEYLESQKIQVEGWKQRKRAVFSERWGKQKRRKKEPISPRRNRPLRWRFIWMNWRKSFL